MFLKIKQRFPVNYTIALVVCIAPLIFCGPVQALDLDVRSNRTSRLDFSVQIAHDKSEIDDGFVDQEVNLERIGIASIEVPIRGPQFGLLLGYAFADFSQDNNYEVLAMDGYYIGVLVNAYLVRKKQFAVSLYLHYLYQDVDGKDNNATSDLRWNEVSADLKFNYRFGPFGSLYGGVNSAFVDASYRYRGLTNARVDLENKNEHGYFAGYDYRINALETVGIRYQKSAIDSIALQFRKIF